jgi:SlyX protein
MTPDAREEIETRIAYLERANTELSDVVVRQQKEIEGLRAELRSLASRLDESQRDEREWTADEERPPHY